MADIVFMIDENELDFLYELESLNHFVVKF